MLLVEGERGIGKSRFLAECASINPLASVIAARCGEAMIEGRDIASQLAEELRRSGVRTQAVPSALCKALADRAKRKLVVVFVDDIQLANAQERMLLDSLVVLAQRHRIAVVGSYVDEGPRRIGIGGLPTDSWLEAGARHLRLQPLEEPAIEIFIRHLSQSSGVELHSDDLREIAATAQGNPRFVVELVESVDSQLRGARIPQTARTIARAARETLSRRAYAVLLVCAVAGIRFKDDWIVGASGEHAVDVGDALQAIADLGLIQEDSGESGWFRFHLVAVRKALYASLVSLKRRTLHERIVNQLVAEPGANRHAVVIAEHYHALEERERASAWFASAAEEHQGRTEFASAAELYERALALRSDHEAATFELRRNLFRCYQRVGEWARSIPVGRLMLDAPEASADREGAARILNDLMIAYLNDGDRPGAETVAGEIANLGMPDRHEIALLFLAVSLCFSGRIADAAAILERIDRAALVSDEAQLRYLLSAAHITTLSQPLETTLALVDEATAIARATGAFSGIVLSLGTGAEVCLRFGHVEQAFAYVDTADEIATASAKENNFLKRMVAHHRIGLLMVLGELPAARDAIASTLDWRDAGRHNEAFTAALGVIVGMHLGDFALVDALFDPDLLWRSIEVRDAESCGLLLPAFAEIMLARGMEKELKRAVARCIEHGYIDTCGWVQMCGARFGSPEIIDLAAAQITEYFGGAVAPIAAAHVANFNALASQRRGQYAAASSFARDAATRYGALGWRLSEAMAFELAGEHSRALDLFEACSADADVARLRACQTRKGKRAPFGARLTPRELEVARLVVRKWSNGDISRALGLSVRTIDHHVEAAFSKLGVRARWQLTEQLLEPPSIGGQS